MKLFLDCEFNGFGGELLSIALVPEVGASFYMIVGDTTETPTEWVAQNVIPVLRAYRNWDQTATRNQIRLALQEYVMSFDAVHIVADWPEDIIHFCKLILTDTPGQRLDTPPLTMEIVRIDSDSEQPHNALSDAIGIRQKYSNQQSESFIMKEGRDAFCSNDDNPRCPYARGTQEFEWWTDGWNGVAFDC
jgi:hypothetical protein